MTVPREVFEEARQWIDEALAEVYSDLIVKPAELTPGHWYLWPFRDVELHLEETKIWEYGVPVADTGRLQAHLYHPYGNSYRIRPRPADSPFTKKLARKAVEQARGLTDLRAEHLRASSMGGQEAYLFGYSSVFDAPENRRTQLLNTWKVSNRDRSWAPLHNLIKEWFFDARLRDPEKWDRLFSGEQQYRHPREWSPRQRGYNPNAYDIFFHGALDAVGDMYEGKRFY